MSKQNFIVVIDQNLSEKLNAEFRSMKFTHIAEKMDIAYNTLRSRFAVNGKTEPDFINKALSFVGKKAVFSIDGQKLVTKIESL
jgi:hypothetical protein